MLSSDCTGKVGQWTCSWPLKHLKAAYLNRKLNFMWLAKHCRAHWAHTGSRYHRRWVWKHTHFACEPSLLTNQNICHTMAQGKDQSFASRLFHKYRKGSQENRVQESEVPQISDLAIMWDKASKCGSLLFTLTFVRCVVILSRLGFRLHFLLFYLIKSTKFCINQIVFDKPLLFFTCKKPPSFITGYLTDLFIF